MRQRRYRKQKRSTGGTTGVQRNEHPMQGEQPTITATPDGITRLRAIAAPLLVFPRHSQGEAASAPRAYPIALAGGYVAIFHVLLRTSTAVFPFKPKKNQPTTICIKMLMLLLALQQPMRTCCLGVGFGGLKGHLAAPTGLPSLEKRTSARDTARAKDDMKCRSAVLPRARAPLWR